MKMFVGLESFADELSAFGQEDIVCAVRETIRRARKAAGVLVLASPCQARVRVA